MNDRERLATVKQLIQGKEYEAARAILKNMPHNQTAILWLSKLDKIAHSKVDSSPAISNTSGSNSRGKQHIVAILAILGLLLLAFEYSLKSLPIPYAGYEITGICPEIRWLHANEDQISEFLDQIDSASSTPRSSVGSYVVAMQRAKRIFDDAPYPKCIEEGRDKLSSGMSLTISGFNSFAAGDDTLAFIDLQTAKDDFKSAYDYFLDEHHIPLDIRLIINSWGW